MKRKIVYGFAQSPFGEMIVARSPLGICDAQFLTYNRGSVIHELGTRWGVYTPTEQDDKVAKQLVESFFDNVRHPIILDLQGTDFQKEVWRALRMVPFGMTVSYQDIAESIGKPTAVRAVATAIAQNPIALLVPCHRVIRSTGETGEYHWGRELKQKLIDWEREEKKRREE